MNKLNSECKPFFDTGAVVFAATLMLCFGLRLWFDSDSTVCDALSIITIAISIVPCVLIAVRNYWLRQIKKIKASEESRRVETPFRQSGGPELSPAELDAILLEHEPMLYLKRKQPKVYFRPFVVALKALLLLAGLAAFVVVGRTALDVAKRVNDLREPTMKGYRPDAKTYNPHFDDAAAWRIAPRDSQPAMGYFQPSMGCLIFPKDGCTHLICGQSSVAYCEILTPSNQ